jgi:hypothetical protein
MEIKQFDLSYNDLEIDRTTIAKLLKFGPGEIPPHFAEMIDSELEIASSLCRISGGYRIVDQVIVDRTNKVIRVDETDFFVGKNISVYLNRAEKIALLLCTAGPGIEKRSQQLMKEGHYPEGFIIDIIGSVVVDAAMDKIHEMLISDMERRGLKVSNRYSPGYCKWDVSEQKKFFLFFPEHFGQISLSESCLMSPIKSISGIAGVGKEIKYLEYVCDSCTLTDCVFRNLKY